MCFTKGGAESIKKAIQAKSLCTAQYDSGLQISGKFKQVLCDAVGNAIYLRTEGATQIAYQDTELSRHGVETHATGFGSPVGRLKGLNKCLSRYSVDELKTLGIRVGSNVTHWNTSPVLRSREYFETLSAVINTISCCRSRAARSTILTAPPSSPLNGAHMILPLGPLSRRFMVVLPIEKNCSSSSQSPAVKR